MVAKVDGIRTGGKRRSVEVRVEDLVGEGDPAAGGSAGQHAGPRLANDPEAFFDGRNQLLHDGVAVGTAVVRIHTVRVVVVRRRMLQRHVDEARRRRCLPVAIERPSATEAARRCRREVALLVVDRIALCRVAVVARRKQNRRAELDRVAPPLAEDLTLDADSLDEFGIRRRLPRRDDFVGDEADRLAARGGEGYFDRRAIQIPGRLLPVLSFPLIHVQPDRLAVGARETRVDVDERLHPVVAGRKVAQARHRIAAIRRTDRRVRSSGECFDIPGKQRHAGRPRLLDGCAAVIAGNRDVDHAGDRLIACGSREADFDARSGRGALSRSGATSRQRHDRCRKQRAPPRSHTRLS